MRPDVYKQIEDELRGLLADIIIDVQNGKDYNTAITPTILNDMVKRVYIHAPQKVDGKRTQDVDIYYDLVGFLPMSLFQTEKQDRVA